MEILLGVIGAFTFFSLNKKKETFENVILDSESYQRPKIPPVKESELTQTQKSNIDQFMNDLEDNKYTFIKNNSLYSDKKIDGIPLKDYFEDYSKKVLDSNQWFLAKDLPTETTQYLENSQVQQKMEIFTGERQRRDREALGLPTKRESTNLFTPAEKTTGYGYMYGTGGGGPGALLTRNKELESYKSDLKFKTNEKPFEKIMVGKGLALDPEVPAAGGFQEYTRVMPENISDYKSNQLPGRVAGGKWVFSNAPTSQVPVVKNRPNGYYSLCTRGPATGKSVMTAETLRPNNEILLKNQNRSVINYGFGSSSLDSFLCK
jgi:hypothetical protein